MRPPIPISQTRKDELLAFSKANWTGFEFQRFLCVWLRVERAQTPDQIAKTLGWHVHTVRATQQEFIRHGVEAIIEKPRGGRHHAAMTLEEEAEFLDDFASKAGEGTPLVTQALRQALEARLGRSVAKSTVYSLLARHGWRKVVPRRSPSRLHPEDARNF
ncbi:MAG: hypothetical protein H6Q00_2909 [Holophagaceae bacterium]|nr:hypothetical protein [Holophagaceae bacterium]